MLRADGALDVTRNAGDSAQSTLRTPAAALHACSGEWLAADAHASSAQAPPPKMPPLIDEAFGSRRC
jgi:hypothetical protein